LKILYKKVQQVRKDKVTEGDQTNLERRFSEYAERKLYKMG
jgi:hypothetical protein